MKQIVIFVIVLFNIIIVNPIYAQKGTKNDPVYVKLKKKYNNVTYFNAPVPPCTDDWCEWYALVSLPDTNWGIADSKGTVIVEPGQYIENAPSKEKKYQITNVTVAIKKNHGINGYTIMVGNNKVCLIDSTGNVMTPSVFFEREQYPSIYWIEGLYNIDAAGSFFVKYENGQIFLYSSDGKLLSNDVGNGECDCFGEGLCGRKEGTLWGYMDLRTGKMVIPAQYTNITPFSNGTAQVTTKDDKIYLITNPLKNKGKSTVVASTSLNEKRSDIDDNIPKTSQLRENTFVVIIANQNYETFSAPFALGDGTTFKNYCRATLGIPQSNILYYEDATFNNFQSALTRISDLCEVYDGDASVIFYFSGQGASDALGNPYLMAADSRMQLLRQTAYPLEHLFSLLGSLNVQSAIAFIDAGFDNNMRDGKPMDPNSKMTTKPKVAPTIGKLVAITATTGNETAYAYPEQIHGLFTYYLCQKLKVTKGNVTISEISAYLEKNVQGISISLFNNRQTPQIQSSINTNIKL